MTCCSAMPYRRTLPPCGSPSRYAGLPSATLRRESATAGRARDARRLDDVETTLRRFIHRRKLRDRRCRAEQVRQFDWREECGQVQTDVCVGGELFQIPA